MLHLLATLGRMLDSLEISRLHVTLCIYLYYVCFVQFMLIYVGVSNSAYTLAFMGQHFVIGNMQLNYCMLTLTPSDRK
jgi:hypothetical protein